MGKVLASAVANAVHNDGLDAEELYVSACYADEGSTLKRWRPRARGRATRIRKRTSHITIIVSRLPEDRIARRRARARGQHLAAIAAGGRSAAASRPRRLRPERPTDELDTGSEAWPEDAVQADDVVTETEAGPLEESDLDGDGDDEGATARPTTWSPRRRPGRWRSRPRGRGRRRRGHSETEDEPTDDADGEAAEEKGK